MYVYIYIYIYTSYICQFLHDKTERLFWNNLILFWDNLVVEFLHGFLLTFGHCVKSSKGKLISKSLIYGRQIYD
jgi:hypothetical protein